MKQVNATNIMGSPQVISHQAVCGNGGKGCFCSNGTLLEDGTVICGKTGAIFAPEVSDTELFAMRKAFDERNGITPAARLIIPVALAKGFNPRF